MNLKKLKKSGGFTLTEMLIVVAIIAILVIISIPMVSSGLNKAKITTDTANERSAKAATLIEYMTNTKEGTYYYDAVSGKIVTSNTDITPYGQCKDHKNGYLIVTIDANGDAVLSWSTKAATHSEQPTTNEQPTQQADS